MGSSALNKIDLGKKEPPGDNLTQQVKYLEDEIVELKEQLESACVACYTGSAGRGEFQLKAAGASLVEPDWWSGLRFCTSGWRWIRAIFWRGRM
jgi:hypothetical protein